MSDGTAIPNQKVFPAYRTEISHHLQQGDLIEKSDGVKDILKVVHPYYLKADYTHFMVLTQSCDLVRRKAYECKSKYITIAAVRPLRIVILREIESYQDNFERAGMVCSNKHRFALIQFLQRLHNYNEPDYFYLHSEPSFGFTEPHCAFLRLSVSIKSSLHYETCLNARVLSLNDVYQAKLGWRVGDMYSRVGTEDWVDGVESKADFEKRISTLLDSACKWEDDKRLNHAKLNQPSDLIQQGEEAIRNHIANVTTSDIVEETITAVITQLRKINKVTDSQEEVKIANRLKSDPVIARLRKLEKK